MPSMPGSMRSGQAGSFTFPFNRFQRFRHGFILRQVTKKDSPILSNPAPDLQISATDNGNPSKYYSL
jgi:hypothetical protein